ncbi:ilvD [Symbiodinium sp. CCMP2456]|nr:ilvD [Symbiodinium sp. CCMP2456]
MALAPRQPQRALRALRGLLLPCGYEGLSPQAIPAFAPGLGQHKSGDRAMLVLARRCALPRSLGLGTGSIVHPMFSVGEEGIEARLSMDCKIIEAESKGGLKKAALCGPSRNGKSTLAEALRQLYQPDTPVQPPGFEVSHDVAVPCTQGAAGVLLPNENLLLMDSEGVSHSTSLKNSQMSKNLLALTYLNTTLFVWNDRDVLNDAFKDAMSKLAYLREEMQLQGSKPDLLFIRRDDSGLDDLTEEGLEAKLRDMPEVAGLFRQMRAVSLPTPERKDREAIEKNSFGKRRYRSAFKTACERLLSTLGDLGAERPTMQLSEVPDWLQYLSQNSASTRKEVLEAKFDKLLRAHAPQAILAPERPESAETGWLLAHACNWDEQQLRQAVQEVERQLAVAAGIWWKERSVCDCYNKFTSDFESFLTSLPALKKGLADYIQRETEANQLGLLAPSSDPTAEALARDVGWQQDVLAERFLEGVRSCKLPSGESMSGVQGLMEMSERFQELAMQNARLCKRIQNKRLVTKTRTVYRQKANRAAEVIGAVAGMGACALGPAAFPAALGISAVANNVLTATTDDKDDGVGATYRGMWKEGGEVQKTFAAVHHTGMSIHPGLAGMRLAELATSGLEAVEEEYEDYELGDS